MIYKDRHRLWGSSPPSRITAPPPPKTGEGDPVRAHWALLDDALLAEALCLVGLDAAQGFEQGVGVLAQQRWTADRDG